MTAALVIRPSRPPRPSTESSRAEEALIEAVRRDPPDEAALDALVRERSAMIFAHCRMLTRDASMAADLAQETWCRVLQARHRLDPRRSLAAYLMVVATNLWRDRARAARRAGALADDHLSSLDALDVGERAGRHMLAEVLADPSAPGGDEQKLLSMEMERALDALTPRARDILLARYVEDESAAEIGRRYARTEQTITSWLREAVAEMRRQLA